MAHAIKGACGDGVPALDPFHRWSGRSSKYDEAQTDRMWRSIGKVNKIGAGSIFHLAMQNGYEMVNDLAPDDMPANSSEIALGGSVAGTGMPALDMSVLTEGRRDPPVLSLDPFGPYCHYWLLSAAEDRGAPVDYVATGLLAITGALLGNVRWVSPWVGWKEPPIIWMAQVGHPSSGKSPGQDAVREPLTRLEEVIAEGYPDDLREYLTCKQEAKYRREDWEDDVKTSVGDGKPSPVLPENAIEPEKPPCPRIAIVDATPEAVAKLAAVQQRGLLSHRDELAGMIGGFDRYNSGGGERAFWLEAYGGRKYIFTCSPLPGYT